MMTRNKDFSKDYGQNGNKDLTKEQLYESVKFLLEQDSPHFHLHQHKLFTLFSVALQYFLYQSTKIPGTYVLRIENSFLADKLVKKAKDYTTRRFLEKILLPRKMIYNQSTFYLDYFHMSSWTLTQDLPPHKLQGALIVKDSTSRPLKENIDAFEEILDSHQQLVSADNEEINKKSSPIPENFFYTNLQQRVPRSIIISFEQSYPETQKISFPFIKEQERPLQGVYVSSSFAWQEDQDEEEVNLSPGSRSNGAVKED